MMTGGRFLYFCSGLGVGIAAAFLWAPKSGRDARIHLMERASDGADYVRRQGVKMRNTVRDKIDRGKLAVKTTAEAMAEALQEGKAVLRG